MTQPLQTSPKEPRRIIAASSTGTLIEWYDFFIYGSLAVVFSGFFFPTGESSLALLVSVAAFGTGFVVRPLGALFFGRLGDRVGRKKTFLTTLVVMGAAPPSSAAFPSTTPSARPPPYCWSCCGCSWARTRSPHGAGDCPSCSPPSWSPSPSGCG